jgi:AcrR family transcriptional regulator
VTPPRAQDGLLDCALHDEDALRLRPDGRSAGHIFATGGQCHPAAFVDEILQRNVIDQGMAIPRDARGMKTKAVTKPVEGLRSRKKAQQRVELLGAAAELLRDRGFDEMRIEDIANTANVSLKTVYNYFPSKQSILIELLREDRQRMLAAYEEIASNPPGDLAKALALIIHADIGDVVTARKKKLWRELLAAETKSHSKPGDEFEKNREVFKDFVRRILLHFRKKQELSSKVDIDVAVEMIYAIMAFNFRQYCATQSMTPDEFLAITKKQMNLMLMDWNRN